MKCHMTNFYVCLEPKNWHLSSFSKTGLKELELTSFVETLTLWANILISISPSLLLFSLILICRSHNLIIESSGTWHCTWMAVFQVAIQLITSGNYLASPYLSILSCCTREVKPWMRSFCNLLSQCITHNAFGCVPKKTPTANWHIIHPFVY